MSEYCNNRLSERFKNKIPQFLAHLDIWNEKMSKRRAENARYKNQEIK